jgi:hypothetical protein
MYYMERKYQNIPPFRPQVIDFTTHHSHGAEGGFSLTVSVALKALATSRVRTAVSSSV